MEYCFKGFSIDFKNAKLTINNNLVQIDESTFVLFKLLIESSPEVCSKHMLIQAISANKEVTNWSLSELITQTRNIFALAGFKGPLIETVHGKGYKLDDALSKQLNRLKNETAEFSNILNKKVKLAKKWQFPIYFFVTVLCFSIIHLTMTLIHDVNEQSEQVKQLMYSEPEQALGRILWVDDHPENNINEKKFFESNNIGVYTTTSTEEALKLLSLYNYQVVISDMGRNNDSLAGLKLLKTMRSNNDHTPFYMYTWISSDALVEELQSNDSQGFTIESEKLYSQVLPIFTKKNNL